MKKLLYILGLLSFTVFAQQTPGDQQSEVVTIVGGKAHLGNGKTIDNSLIMFENGKLTVVADATTTKIAYRGNIIQANGKHIYPGFIAPNSTLGLVEFDAVRASDDEREIGTFNPHIRSIIAYNSESRVIETMRPNGVLQGQIVPRGGRISGLSSIVQFDAWNWEDAIIKEDDGLHINWPRTFNRSGWWAAPGPTKPNKNYTKQIDELIQFFNKAKQNSTNGSKNLKYESMAAVFSKKRKVYFHAEDEKQIIDAVNFGVSNKLDFVLVGAYDAHKTIDLLKQYNVPVLLQRVHSTPDNDDDDYDLPYKLATILTDAGILVALEPSGDMERMNTRNLPFYAGTCVAFGMNPEQAISLISLNAAKILGIDKTTGSLEVGKDATLFISEGDALDMRTNKLSHAFIQGRTVSLDSHQTELYNRYSKKYKKAK